MSENDWRAEYWSLKNSSASTPPQERGFLFEKILRKMLYSAGLYSRGSYRVKSEQIDGTFEFHGLVYLIEARWRSDPAEAGDLYTFQGKIDGKFQDTAGVFFSIQGYSQGALDGLVRRGNLNLILFDGSDMDALAGEAVGFAELFSLKLRAAREEGRPFVPFNSKMAGHRSITTLHDHVANRRDAGFATKPQCKNCEAASIAKMYSHVEEGTGRKYRIDDLTLSVSGQSKFSYEWCGTHPGIGRCWRYTRENMDRLLSEGRIHFRPNRTPRYKQYLDERQGPSRRDIRK